LESNRRSHASGQIAAATPIASVSANDAAAPMNAMRPGVLAGADVYADHRDQGAADAEHQRPHHILKPSAGAVTGDFGGTEPGADQGSGDGDRQVGLQ